MDKGKLTVKGQREVQRAFSRLADDITDLTNDNADIAERVIEKVRRNTRRATGTLADSWIAGGEATRQTFTNPLAYAPVQEFGSEVRNITPTNAVKLAFEESENDITDGYGKAIVKRARKRNIRTTD